MRIRGLFLVIQSCVLLLPMIGFAQERTTNLFNNLIIVEKESAEAKKVRLEWIGQERARLRVEMQKYEGELSELQQIVPDAARPRVMTAAASRAREVEEKQFNSWVSTNDPTLRAAVLKGEGLNALLRVLGPVAHYRKTRTNNATAARVFPSLSPANEIKSADAEHFRLSPATSAGSQLIVRPNQMPLELEWPSVVRQNWKDECASIAKTRDAYVALLGVGATGDDYLDRADLLDKSLSLLQLKIINAKSKMLADKSTEVKKRYDTFRDMQDALRYLESVRATVDRFKKVPGDYKVRRFSGGSIEEFLDFCYTHGMIFQKSQPADEQYYWDVHVRMKDYAKDVQFVEDWKNDLEQRIRELNSEDQKLVWRASEQ